MRAECSVQVFARGARSNAHAQIAANWRCTEQAR